MQSIQTVSLLLSSALLLMGSPGPATMSLAATGAAFGVRRGTPYLAGIILGTTSVLAVVATGVTGIVFAIPGATPVIVGAAFAYILYLAYQIATAPPPQEASASDVQPSLLGGLFLGVANPKAYAAIGAVYASAVLVADRPLLDGAMKFVLLMGVIVLVNAFWLAVGATLSGVLRRPRTARIVNISFAILLVASFALSVLV
jgi:threonine/homoserine/homoserine lactone efflux protein